MNQEDEIRGVAERQVDYFVESVTRRYGINPSELPAIIENLRWLDRHRRTAARIAGGVTVSAVAAVAVMTIYALFEGVRHFIVNGGPK